MVLRGLRVQTSRKYATYRFLSIARLQACSHNTTQCSLDQRPLGRIRGCWRLLHKAFARDTLQLYAHLNTFNFRFAREDLDTLGFPWIVAISLNLAEPNITFRPPSHVQDLDARGENISQLSPALWAGDMRILTD